jgi:hypothetical protein
MNQEQSKQSAGNLSEEVVVVSGLPRTGTSMMMRMLEAGGLPVLADNLRVQDEDNPRGYYEFEPVKKTKEDSSWLDGAKGRVVKMVYRLLYDLPVGHKYRVVFMERALEEVIASQNIMLKRNDQNLPEGDDQQTIKLFESELSRCFEWLETRKDFEVLTVNYNRLMTNPQDSIEEIDQFMKNCLDAEAMAAAVEPALYRNRR